jgi:hypothetical protein
MRGRFACHRIVCDRTTRNPVVPRALACHPRLTSSYCLCGATRSETAITATEGPCTGTAAQVTAAAAAEVPASAAATGMAATSASAASAPTGMSATATSATTTASG